MERCVFAVMAVFTGNCLNLNGDKEKAKELYLEAIGVEADCVEAIYNLGTAVILSLSYCTATFLCHLSCLLETSWRI
jgi:hypothetical protein